METEIMNKLNEIERLTLLAAKNVLSVEDVALLLGIAPKTVRNKIQDMPHYRNADGRIWFRRSEIEDWQCQVKCTPARVTMGL